MYSVYSGESFLKHDLVYLDLQGLTYLCSCVLLTLTDRHETSQVLITGYRMSLNSDTAWIWTAVAISYGMSESSHKLWNVRQ